MGFGRVGEDGKGMKSGMGMRNSVPSVDRTAFFWRTGARRWWGRGKGSAAEFPGLPFWAA